MYHRRISQNVNMNKQEPHTDKGTNYIIIVYKEVFT